MKMEFPVEEAVRARYSVRSYEERLLSEKEKSQLKAYSETVSNPFSVQVSFHLLESKNAVNGDKLGTYGMIKGAKDYIGATVADEKLALEALGYSFEKLILYAASKGIGTCWLGGTFKRSQFALAMEIKENELFPAITPIGYPLKKKRLTESIVRKVVKADQRKDWNELFFKDDFSHPLTKAEAGEFEFPLEMLRLAPSASNKQPWRIVQKDNTYHFYEARTPGYSEKLALDIQRVDIGIAACHFHLAVLEKGIAGRFEKLTNPEIQLPENMYYIFSFLAQ
ncbi:nitroreductase family protein [Anaerocolumna chitinilytica]|uniref:Nitroreductase n=1 Tax=Anaerocolumna chitinilytica TaxID=1727145 RepID=A0A7I8DL13_9FIRM|nr:nitroreductase family protein [Anaerocolumna chitinilytica]BCJ99050.1 nitroreductase [Anaerocolumna chitinilytica]